MKTLKKFLIYFILFILLFLFVTFLTEFGMRDVYKDTKYEIKTTSPQINVVEAKATYSYGYINGTVTNDTGEHIKSCYIKIDIYNINGTYLGTEYKQLDYFNVDETINFDIEYNKYTNIKLVKLDIVEQIDNQTVDKKDGVFSLMKLRYNFK